MRAHPQYKQHKQNVKVSKLHYCSAQRRELAVVFCLPKVRRKVKKLCAALLICSGPISLIHAVAQLQVPKQINRLVLCAFSYVDNISGRLRQNLYSFLVNFICDVYVKYRYLYSYLLKFSNLVRNIYMTLHWRERDLHPMGCAFKSQQLQYLYSRNILHVERKTFFFA